MWFNEDMSAAATKTTDEILDDAGQDMDWAWESYSEIRAEAANETALFGDAWPGAAIQVADAHRAAVEAEARYWHLASVHGRMAVHGPTMPFQDDGTEPF